MPLPVPGTPPDAIYPSFVNLRARTIDFEKICMSGCDAALYEELEAKLLINSPDMFTRLICCRAEVAELLREPGRKEWWLTAMDLYDAFLSSQGPRSALDEICAHDLYRYRERQVE